MTCCYVIFSLTSFATLCLSANFSPERTAISCSKATMISSYYPSTVLLLTLSISNATDWFLNTLRLPTSSNIAFTVTSATYEFSAASCYTFLIVSFSRIISFSANLASSFNRRNSLSMTCLNSVTIFWFTFSSLLYAISTYI